MFLKNKNISPKIKRSKVTDYAALSTKYVFISTCICTYALLDPVLLHDANLPLTNEPVHEISNNVVCATSKASDQPAHTRSLIRAFASRFSIL